MRLCLDGLPEELKIGVNHVNWRYEQGTKVLKIAGTLSNASSTNSRTWRPFRECVTAMERHPGRYAGVGRVIAKDDPFVGVDLDDVRDPETGKLSSRASEIVGRLDSYAEVSPSETGMKLWIRARLERAYKKPGVEIYPRGRYFTLTGWMLPQALPTVEERQAELEALIREEFPDPEKRPRRPYEGKPGERIDLVEFLAAGGVEVLAEIPDGTAERVYGVVCPWWHEHTGCDTSGTRVGQYADGALVPLRACPLCSSRVVGVQGVSCATPPRKSAGQRPGGSGRGPVVADTKPYEVDELEFEFTPIGSPFEGLLMVTWSEETFSSLVNLMKHGSRTIWAKEAAELYGADVSRLKRALNELFTLRREEVAVAEAMSEEETAEVPDIDPERHERAMELLKHPDILEEAAGDMELLGHVGERTTKKLALICALSAKSGKPIQPSTHAQSSAGKNALWDATLSLFPEEMVVRRSGLTAKALFRIEADLEGAILYLQEVAGSEDANYSIRVMQSDGRLEYEATEKAPDGSMKNVVYRTEGPTVIVQTTTKNHLHPENETRVFPIYIDESEEQTGRIVESILKDAAGAGVSSADRRRIRERWHDAIRLLEPDQEVVIPYAERIEIPSSPIRIRRDARRLMDVVRVIAWLHQHGRERDAVGRIIATEDDFHVALRLVSESLTRAWRTLTPAEETMLETIKVLSDQLKTRGFRRRDLKVKGVSDRRVKEVLKSLTDTGYLDCDGRQGPQGYSYTVAREAEEVSLGISLRPPPDRQESPANNEISTGWDASARYRPVPDSEEQGNGYREAGATGRTGHRPIKDGDLQEERSTERTGGEDEMCIHDKRGGCWLCQRRIERLVSEGMALALARAEVLGSNS